MTGELCLEFYEIVTYLRLKAELRVETPATIHRIYQDLRSMPHEEVTLRKIDVEDEFYLYLEEKAKLVIYIKQFNNNNK